MRFSWKTAIMLPIVLIRVYLYHYQFTNWGQCPPEAVHSDVICLFTLGLFLCLLGSSCCPIVTFILPISWFLWTTNSSPVACWFPLWLEFSLAFFTWWPVACTCSVLILDYFQLVFGLAREETTQYVEIRTVLLEEVLKLLVLLFGPHFRFLFGVEAVIAWEGVGFTWSLALVFWFFLLS